MIKVTALTSGRHDPSSRFRIRQFIEPLRGLGISVTEHYPPINRYRLEPLPLLVGAMRLPGLFASQFSDIAWLGRELISGRSTFEHLVGKKRILDVDDAIWVNYKEDFSARIARHCYGIIVGNQFLAEHYESLGAKVWLVPTSVDTERWLPGDKSNRRSHRWTIGWTGSWSSLKFLHEIESPLSHFLEQHRNSRLLVVCDRKPVFERIPDEAWTFVPWSPANEVKSIQEMDVGLMPLDQSTFAHGKCGFKLLLYMAVGLPAIVSPIGVNAEIIAGGDVGLPARSSGDWIEALCMLHDNPGMCDRMGVAGRRVVEARYSVKANVAELAKVFRQVMDS